MCSQRMLGGKSANVGPPPFYGIDSDVGSLPLEVEFHGVARRAFEMGLEAEEAVSLGCGTMAAGGNDARRFVGFTGSAVEDSAASQGTLQQEMIQSVAAQAIRGFRQIPKRLAAIETQQKTP